MIRITRCRKVYVGGLRIHHGPVGVLMALAGAILIAHDWNDRWWSLRDEEMGNGSKADT